VGGIPVTGAAENSAALALGNLRVGADDIAFWSTGSRRLLLLAEGTGALLPYFLSLGVNVWAADPAYRAEVVQTSRGLKNYVTKFGPRLWPLAANELHKTDMLFDVVLAHHFLNNLSLQEALDVLPAVYARLEPGGEFRFNTGEAMALFLDERARSLPRREGEDATIEVSGDWVRLRRGQRSALRLDRRQEIARTTLARHSKGVVSGGLGLKTYLKEPGDFIDIFGLSPDEARAFAEKVARANPSVHDGEEVARRGLFSTRALAFTSTPRAFDATSERPIGLPPSLIVRLTRDF
jgi:hypothetical protein